MALTISQVGNATIVASAAAVTTGTLSAAVGDWLVAIVAASNDGSQGASAIGNVTDSGGANTWTNRATINYDPGSAGAGATLRIATCTVTATITTKTVSCAFSPNVTEAGIQVYKVVPASGDTITFIAADATGVTGNLTSYAAATVSVTSGHVIFGAAAIETDDAITGDSDTTNGSWSTIWTILADAGLDAAAMCVNSQYKAVTATGNQSWAATSSTARDSAITYLVIAPVNVALANDVESASSVSQPAIHQVHAILANDVSSTSSVSVPTLRQVHALLANDVSSASSVSNPDANVVNILLANDVESASSVSVPAVGQKHALLANDVSSNSSVSTPVVHQVHALLANDVSSASSVSVPTLHQVHALLANDVQSAASVSVPTITQRHALLASDVESASTVSHPALSLGSARPPHRITLVA